jgi:hypothetical protein
MARVWRQPVRANLSDARPATGPIHDRTDNV